MKRGLVILIFLMSCLSYSQESFFFKEKDTLFIVYNNSLNNKNIIKNYININPTKNKTIGLKSIYFLLDTTLVKKRDGFYKRFEESIKKGNAPGASSTCDWCFGLYFVHIYGKIKFTKQSYLIDPFIINHKKRFEEKVNKSLKDTLSFDKYVFNMVYYRYNPPVVSLQLSEKELNEKKVFYFDGSTKKYNELKELVKEPHYLFMLDKKWVKQEFNSDFFKTEYYIFNEVRYRNSYKFVPD